jgi:hypothetical protein
LPAPFARLSSNAPLAAGAPRCCGAEGRAPWPE